VTDQMACAFNVMLLMLEQGAADEDVTVYISSPGGSVSAGLSMADTMALVSCDVATVCVGQAASIGAVLLMCGTKGKRTILPHSNVLIHQPSLSGGERPSMQTTDLSIVARAMESTRKAVYELMAEATGQSMERIERDCDRDHYLNAAEAVEYGIADAVARPHPRPDAGRRDDADED
jgi:ATP-dependent Clp protease protease subunit